MTNIRKKSKKIIIAGITKEGESFRPSDWAERMSGHLSTFKNHRIFYSPLLRPSYQGGNRCVIVDAELKDINPTLYEHILEFAKVNRLKMDESDDPIPHEEEQQDKKTT